MVEKNAFVTESWMGRTACEDWRRDIAGIASVGLCNFWDMTANIGQDGRGPSTS